MHQRDTPLLQNNRPAILEYLDIADVIPLRFEDLKQSSFIAQNEMRARLISMPSGVMQSLVSV